MSRAQPTFNRRRLLVGAAGSLTAPAMARTPGRLTLRMQTTWTARDIFQEFAHDFARKVGTMTGGRLTIEVLPAGAQVKAFDLIDAVSRGAVDMGHGVLSYWAQRNSALALWGSGPAFGMDANTVLAWHEYGGGKTLLEEIYKGLELNVRSFLYGPMPSQPLGWFKKPIRNLEDLRGLRFRTVGLAMDMMTELGMRVTALPSGEIVSAIDRGQLDAGEFNNPTSDRALGFPEVARYCLLQSFHQASEQFEILINRRRFEALPAEQQAIIGIAAQACSAEMSWKAIDRYSRDYLTLIESGVQFMRTPETILQAQLKGWDQILARKSAENPMFRRVAESMQRFAERACRWQDETQVDHRLAYRIKRR